MDRKGFVDALFDFFKGADESKKQSYEIAFMTSKNIDWDRLYAIVVREAESTFLPSPRWIRDLFYRCIKQDNYNRYANDGTKVVVTLSDGYSYEYELWGCSKTQQEIRQGLKRKFSYLSHDEQGNEIKRTKVTRIEFIKEDEGENEQAFRSGEVFA